MARRVIFDPWLLLITAVLVGGGWFMVGSASNYVALEFGKSPSAYGWRHLLHLLLGCGALLAMLSFPYQKLAERWVVRTVVGFSMAALVFVLSMPEICDARRWIPLLVFNFQPSEFAKLAIVLYMSWVLSRNQEKVNDSWTVPLPCLLVVGTTALLVVVEPDLGSAVVPVVVAGVMIFIAGLRWRYLMGFAGLGALAFAAAVVAEPYRMSQRALFLPAPHTDFIFSVVGEDFGLIGCGVVLAAFLLLFWRGLRAAMRAPDRFGFYLALGITSTLVLQGLINMGVCVGLLPTKGLPLPFISYGGSSLLVSMTAMGLLLNVSLHSN
jgi:cell division protein FtsW